MSGELVFSIYGKGASLPILLLNDPILGAVSRKLLFEARKGVQLGKNSRIVLTEEALKRILALYASIGVLKREDSAFLAVVPILDKEEKKPFIELASAYSKDLSSYVMRHMVEIKRKFEHTSLPSRGYSWDEVSFTVIAGMILDQFLFAGLHETGILPYPPARPDGGQWYIWALEGGSGSPVEYWIRTTEYPEGGYASIWIRGVAREYVPMDASKLRLLLAIAEKPRTIEELAYELRIPLEYVDNIIRMWHESGFVHLERGKVIPKALVLLDNDVNILMRAARRMGRELADSIIRRRVSDLLKLKYQLGYLHLEDGSYLAMMIQIMRNYAVSELISEGILPSVPKSVDASWGFWAWSGTERRGV